MNDNDEIWRRIHAAERELGQEQQRHNEYVTMDNQISAATNHLQNAINHLNTAYEQLLIHYNDNNESRDDGRIDNRVQEIREIIDNLEGTVMTASNDDKTVISNNMTDINNRISSLRSSLI